MKVPTFPWPKHSHQFLRSWLPHKMSLKSHPWLWAFSLWLIETIGHFSLSSWVMAGVKCCGLIIDGSTCWVISVPGCVVRTTGDWEWGQGWQLVVPGGSLVVPWSPGPAHQDTCAKHQPSKMSSRGLSSYRQSFHLRWDNYKWIVFTYLPLCPLCPGPLVSVHAAVAGSGRSGPSAWVGWPGIIVLSGHLIFKSVGINEFQMRRSFIIDKLVLSMVRVCTGRNLQDLKGWCSLHSLHSLQSCCLS